MGVMAGSRVPYFALDFLLHHLAHVHVNFLLLVLPGAFLPGVRLFDPFVAANLHLANAFFFLANGHMVLVGDFFLDVFANANLVSLLLGLADGDLVGVGLGRDLCFVAGVFDFGFHEVWNPNLADGCCGAATADSATVGNAALLLAAALCDDAVFHDALFPVTFVFTNLALLDDRYHVANVADAAALFFVGDHHSAGNVLLDPHRLADDLNAVAFFAGGYENLVLVINFFADSLADLASAGLFNPLGNADVDDPLFNDGFRYADGSLHNFPGAGRFAGNGARG